MDQNINRDAINTKEFSKTLFSFLCDAVGSEKVVETRRLFFKTMDDAFKHRPLETFISSGSKAEGLDMTGSDLDIMVVCDLLPVYHYRSEVTSLIGFITDSENAAPGFVLLKGISGINDPSIFTYTEYGPILSNEKFKLVVKRFGQRPYEELMDIHGPCLTPVNELIDVAYCLKSQSWPQIAMKWLYRPRSAKWPSCNVLTAISEEGLLYVPIGSKFGATESNPFEWRISFSVQEKMLIHSFNHTQLLCYATLKIVLNEIINKTSSIEGLLCSYFLKTVVFLISEESEPSSWIPENLYACFKSCLRRLIYWVRLGNCPNYFIPQNNMFEGKIVGKNQETLLTFLETLLENGTHFISQSSTLCQITKHDSILHRNRSHDMDIALYPLLNIFLKFHSVGIEPDRYLPLFVNKIKHVDHCTTQKTLYMLWLCTFCVQVIIEMKYCIHNKNKELYHQYKRLKFYCLIGKNTDVVSGWLWLAMFFYQHKEYSKALLVINFALTECTPDKVFIRDQMPSVFDEREYKFVKSTFFQRHRLSCIYQIYRVPKPHSIFFNTDLGVTDFEQGIIGPPIVFIHFLSFMCNHHWGKLTARDKSLQDIKYTIEENFFTGLSDLTFFSYCLLLKALELANRYEEIPHFKHKLFLEFAKLPSSLFKGFNIEGLLSDLTQKQKHQ